MPRTAAYKTASSINNSLDFGLYLTGTVLYRTKRSVPADNPSTEIVTYTVQDDKSHQYYVDDYAPSDYHEIGEVVHLPVYIKPYKKKTGDLSYSLNIQKPFSPSTKGEAF